MYYVFKRWADKGVRFKQVSWEFDTLEDAQSFIETMKHTFKHHEDHLVVLQEVNDKVI